PSRSVQMPSRMRTSEPVRIGMPIRRPNSVSLRPSSDLIVTPMIEKIVQTAKQTVKATVDRDSARIADALAPGAAKGASIILRSRTRRVEGGAATKNKKAADRALASVHLGSQDFLIGSFAGCARHWTQIS